MTLSPEDNKPRRMMYSLRLRLMVMSFIIILLPLATTALLLDSLLQKHLAGDVSSQLQSDLSAASLFYDGQVKQMLTSVRTVALDNTVKTTLRLQIFGQLQKQLDELAARMGLDFVVVLDGDGKILLPRFLQSMGMVTLADHPLISLSNQQGLAGSILEENPALLYLLEQSGKEIESKPVVLLEASTPITLRNTVLGIVLGGMLVTDNTSLVASIQEVTGCDQVAVVAADRMAVNTALPATSPGKGPYLFPVQLNYEKVQRPDIERRIIYPGNDKEMVYGYIPIPTLGRDTELALVVLRPLDTLLRIITRLRSILLFIFGFAILFACIAAVIMSRSIARPLHEITCSMEDIKQGKKVPLLSSHREDEIGDLVKGFNDMALSLEKRLRELNAEITSRELTEDRLAAESERFRVTLQSMEDAVFATNINGRVVLMNRVAEMFTSWKRENATGKPLADILDISLPGRGDEAVDPLQWLDRKWDGDTSVDCDLQLFSLAGDQRLVTLSGSPLIDRQHNVIGAVMVLRDVTGTRRMEQELVKTQKLESVGVLAGGIAHDFNNLLTAIMGNLSLAGLSSQPSDPHYQNIQDAEKATLRAQKLTKQLLTFSRGGSPVKETVELTALIRESAEFVSHGSSVRLRFLSDENIWPVYVDRGQIGQVIDNLVINALQATPAGGFVDIRIDNYSASQDEPLPVAGKRFVRITVQDYGTGITPPHLNKVFDPYFTTKELGSGLGLSICFSIISKHGGHITAESEEGKGSVFTVYLPVDDTDAADSDVSQEVTSTSQPSGLRVLVLDDEEMVLSVVTRMLQALGYEVDGVADGADVLELYSRAFAEEKTYDVVILDLTIPGGMGGEEVVTRLAVIDPDVRAIVASGYSDHKIMSEYRRFGFVGVVAKPFRLDDLRQAVQEAVKG